MVQPGVIQLLCVRVPTPLIYQHLLNAHAQARADVSTDDLLDRASHVPFLNSPPDGVAPSGSLGVNRVGVRRMRRLDENANEPLHVPYSRVVASEIQVV